tara:strand:- start:187 stop:804 length:618 start_codon:yes stop_codon:yes gene_type:complete
MVASPFPNPTVIPVGNRIPVCGSGALLPTFRHSFSSFWKFVFRKSASEKTSSKEFFQTRFENASSVPFSFLLNSIKANRLLTALPKLIGLTNTATLSHKKTSVSSTVCEKSPQKKPQHLATCRGLSTKKATRIQMAKRLFVLNQNISAGHEKVTKSSSPGRDVSIHNRQLPAYADSSPSHKWIRLQDYLLDLNRRMFTMTIILLV